MLLAVASADLLGFETEALHLYVVIPLLLLGFLLVYLLNHYGAGWVASTLFLLIVTAVISAADEPRRVVEGRSLFLFTIPILMASVILRPWASFALAGVSSLVITFLTITVLKGVPPIPTMLSLFAFALVAWISSRNLENALADLREINRELDQRVEERTYELAQANAELEAANDRLKELDRLKSRFVSMVSHELRTPLSAIQGFSEILQAKVYGPITEKQDGAIERIMANTNRLLHIVNDLLDQARIEAGQLALQIEPFAPTDLAEDLHSTMDVIAQNKGLELGTTVTEDLPETLYGDRKRLHQILVNLVNNSLKFTREGGVYVDVTRWDPEHWRIQVRDTGMGMPEEALEYIFEPFRQVDGSATREHKGVGLGLSIVQQLVQLMGGNIKVESELDVGSTFIITLPFAQPEEEESI
jgi:signal transduction histidine kinase